MCVCVVCLTSILNILKKYFTSKLNKILREHRYSIRPKYSAEYGALKFDDEVFH